METISEEVKGRKRTGSERNIKRDREREGEELSFAQKVMERLVKNNKGSQREM